MIGRGGARHDGDRSRSSATEPTARAPASSSASPPAVSRVFPADGLYGLACDPLNQEAIERIHRIKGRDDGKPSAVLYFSPLAMRELVESIGDRTRAAVGALLPGPVTLVVANPEHRYPLACREDPERLGRASDRRAAGGGDVPALPDLGEPQRRAGAGPLRRRPAQHPRRGRRGDRRRRPDRIAVDGRRRSRRSIRAASGPSCARAGCRRGSCGSGSGPLNHAVLVD